MKVLNQKLNESQLFIAINSLTFFTSSNATKENFKKHYNFVDIDLKTLLEIYSTFIQTLKFPTSDFKNQVASHLAVLNSNVYSTISDVCYLINEVLAEEIYNVEHGVKNV